MSISMEWMLPIEFIPVLCLFIVFFQYGMRIPSMPIELAVIFDKATGFCMSPLCLESTMILEISWIQSTLWILV